MYCLISYASPIGLLTLGSDGKHLTGLWIQGQKYFGGENVGEIGKEQGPEPAVFGDARKWLDRYFSGQKPCPDELPLAPEGTEFQKLIWGLLCEIPYGTVTTYGALAKKAAARPLFGSYGSAAEEAAAVSPAAAAAEKQDDPDAAVVKAASAAAAASTVISTSAMSAAAAEKDQDPENVAVAPASTSAGRIVGVASASAICSC